MRQALGILLEICLPPPFFIIYYQIYLKVKGGRLVGSYISVAEYKIWIWEARQAQSRGECLHWYKLNNKKRYVGAISPSYMWGSSFHSHSQSQNIGVFQSQFQGLEIVFLIPILIAKNWLLISIRNFKIWQEASPFPNPNCMPELR